MYLRYAVLTTINKLIVESIIFLLHEFKEINRIHVKYNIFIVQLYAFITSFYTGIQLLTRPFYTYYNTVN